jgi:hypothetical protein
MRKIIFVGIFLVSLTNSFAQSANDTIDYKYLEDQLYLSLSYNILFNKPEEDNNSPFSLGISFGFIRDIPLNKQRNFGIGIGLGYGFNSYKNTITLYDDADDSTGLVQEFQTEKIKTNVVEMPFQIRWRTSTPTRYNFWRIYGGLKVAYIFFSKSKLNYENESVTIKNMEPLNKFQCGTTLSVGYGTWNLYTYYGLSKLFNSTGSNGEPSDVKDFNIGLIFYIL